MGAVLENVVFDPITRIVDYNDKTLTVNTRVAYPLEHIPNAKLPGLATHPTNIIFLTSDTRGILPLVAKLNNNQAVYHYLNGYSPKVDKRRRINDDLDANFSACFSEPFLVLNPVHYAKMLAERLAKHKPDIWLINAGYVGHSYSQGPKTPKSQIKAVIDAIHDGSIKVGGFETVPVFQYQVPLRCPGLLSGYLNPAKKWEGTPDEFNEETLKLAQLFQMNYSKYQDQMGEHILVLSRGDVVNNSPVDLQFEAFDQ
jgi:phosphoenolpyruvate carboxykinase (ATP)